MTTPPVTDRTTDFAGTSPGACSTNRSAPLGGHLTVLDGVRGLAILLVMIYHFTMGMAGQSLSGRLLFKLTSLGWCGVNLFFVLSGFLITGILYDTRASVHRFRNFYMRRALRIFPLYYGSLLLLFGLVPWLGRWSDGFKGIEHAWPWLWTYGTNILVSLEGRWFPLSHYWSLAVEEHFYLVWPLVVFSLDRRSSIRACLALIAIALVIRIGLVRHGLVLSAYTLTLSRMDGLALGALIALLIRGEHGFDTIVPLAAKGAKLSGTALVFLMLWRLGLTFHDSMVQTLGYFLLDLFFASLIVLLVVAPKMAPLARIFNLGVLRSLGRYSYGIYVYNSIFVLLSDGFSIPTRVAAWTNSVAIERVIYVAIATFSTLSMAWLSWHLLEKPFMRLKVYFESRPVVSAN